MTCLTASVKVRNVKKQIEFGFFVTIPHAGEQIPPDCDWLRQLPEPLLMQDVDRYVDRLYKPSLQALQISCVVAPWHRYAADLNRFPEDVDAGSVIGNALPRGRFPRGFHWQMTTRQEVLMPAPISLERHLALVKLVHEPFHSEVQKMISGLRQSETTELFHLDLHSMPSVGTSEHRDPGETRADIVISDASGQSARREFVDAVLVSYLRAGFRVAYNWPYLGGRLTEQYGQPQHKHHTVQVELNRSLYMEESTKQWLPKAAGVQAKLDLALRNLVAVMPSLLQGFSE